MYKNREGRAGLYLQTLPKIFKRFDSKRVRNTEFFELDASDVAAFKRRKYQ
jgi:hypothetical protein